MAPVLLGSAAVGAAGTAGATAATAGLFGSAGAFSAVSTLTTLGTAMSALGALQQGNAAKSAAQYNAAVSRNNAIAARQKATADAARQERESRLRAGQVGAAVGASGGTTEGSALDILESNAAQEELDRLTIIHGGDISGQGFESDATVQGMRGSAAQKQGRMGAASALVLGGAKTFGSA